MTSDKVQPAAGFGLPDVLAVGLAVVWGANFVIAKQALAELSPLSFNGLRFIGATLFLLVALRLMGENWHVERADLPRMLALGLVSITIYQVLFITGLNLSTATNSSLALATSPTLVVVLGTLLGMARPTRRTWVGVALALSGLLLVIGGKQQGLHFGGTTLAGDLMVFGSAVTWAVYTLYVPPLFRRYSSLKATTVVMAIGTVPLCLVALPEWVRQDWSRVTAVGWGGLLFSTVMSIALGYVVYYYCVKRLGASRAAAYFNLPPVFAVILAFLVLGERMTLWQGIGAIVVLIGVYLTRR